MDSHGGVVGIANNGNTCYLNAVVQLLHSNTELRHSLKAVTENNINPAFPLKYTLLNLCSVFSQLESEGEPVTTDDLVASLFVDDFDPTEQNDAMQLWHIFCNMIKEGLKLTNQRGVIDRLFLGTKLNCYTALNVEFKNVKQEAFYDVTLDVEDCTDLYSAMNKVVSPEVMEYNTYELYGKQQTKLCVKFERFPPVMVFHLKRFKHVDTAKGSLSVKINSKFVYYSTIELGHLLNKDASPKYSRYHLKGVIVHSGICKNGHYVAYVKHDKQWYLCDDDVVEKCSEEEVVNPANFGGENPSDPHHDKTSNAYILMYELDKHDDDPKRCVCGSIIKGDQKGLICMKCESTHQIKPGSKRKKWESTAPSSQEEKPKPDLKKDQFFEHGRKFLVNELGKIDAPPQLRESCLNSYTDASLVFPRSEGFSGALLVRNFENMVLNDLPDNAKKQYAVAKKFFDENY